MIHAMRVIPLLHDSVTNFHPVPRINDRIFLIVGSFLLLFFFLFYEPARSQLSFPSSIPSLPPVNTSSNLVTISDNASWFYRGSRRNRSRSLKGNFRSYYFFYHVCSSIFTLYSNNRNERKERNVIVLLQIFFRSRRKESA